VFGIQRRNLIVSFGNVEAFCLFYGYDPEHMKMSGPLFMSLSKSLVALTALVFLLYGLGFVLAPELLSQFVVDAVPAAGSAMTDMRATYGGMSVAVGVMLLLLARSDVRLGLVAVLLLMVCMAAGRGYGLYVDAQANTLMYVYLLLEAVAAMAAVLLLSMAASGGGEL
jgi:uncharacterized protein YjeT (DUF2065 family)